MKRNRTGTIDEPREQTGLCEEAQADGVPCYEMGRQCETCERQRKAPPPPRKPRTPRKPRATRS